MKSPGKLLLGIWRSDKRQTLKNLHRYHQLPLGKKRILGGIFGKMELRWTPKFVYTYLKGKTRRERYDFVAEDNESVVVRCYSDALRNELDWVVEEGVYRSFCPSYSKYILRLSTVSNTTGLA